MRKKDGNYGRSIIAAVPPGDEGKQLARKLLEQAWDHDHDKISEIESWQPEENLIYDYLNKVKNLLNYHGDIHIVIVYFVGGFENNPFVAPYGDGRPALCLPIENGSSEMLLTHELTHIVHSHTASLSSGWERTIASTIIQEGLAMHVSKYLVPGYPDEAYTEHKEGWLQACKKKRLKILEGIYPYLSESSSETVTKFTFGTGTTNTEREAYFAGWEMIEYRLDQGYTFKPIANIQEQNLPDFLREIYPNFLRWK